ncbi:hypothetical protein M2J90_002633 [Listeria monocytogenes]|nr:hypothetical protein [Listeria monocytogenes]
MNGLTKELQKLGFYCGIELILYIQDTGNYTSLVIEGENYQGSIYYDFYKQTFYPHYPNKITVYGEYLSPSQLIERVEIYLTNRKKFIEERKSNL